MKNLDELIKQRAEIEGQLAIIQSQITDARLSKSEGTTVARLKTDLALSRERCVGLQEDVKTLKALLAGALHGKHGNISKVAEIMDVSTQTVNHHFHRLARMLWREIREETEVL